MTDLPSSLLASHKPSAIQRAFSIPKSSFYYKPLSETISIRKKQNAILKPILADIFNECRASYGVKRYTYAVKARNLPFPVGCNRIRKPMKALGLRCNTLKKFRPHSKDKVCELGKNLLERQFRQSQLNKVWVTDITYIYISGLSKFAYLATVIDLADRKPVGWHFSERMTADTAILALKDALRKQNHPKNVMIHSDRGAQYTSYAFRSFLSAMQLTQSFSHKGCPYDNAVIESFHSSLKKELIYRTTFYSFGQAKLKLLEYIDYFYTKVRIHSALGYITPKQMETKLTIENGRTHSQLQTSNSA